MTYDGWCEGSSKGDVIWISTAMAGSRPKFVRTPEKDKKDAYLAPAASSPGTANMPSSWGTRRRLDAVVSRMDEGDLNSLIDRAMQMSSPPPFLAGFRPQAHWLWRQWTGTVLQHTFQPAVVMMLVSCVLIVAMEPIRVSGGHTWALFGVPDAEDTVVAQLRGFTTMWGYLLTMATFVNSFFLSQVAANPNLNPNPDPSGRL